MKFPDFCPVGDSNISEVYAVIACLRPTSDFFPTSLFCFGEGGKISYTTSDGIFIARFENYLRPEIIYSLLIPSDSSASKLQKLLDCLIAMQIKTLELLPCDVMEALNAVGLVKVVEKQRDQYDYLYASEQLAQLKGPKYRRRRRDAMLFQRNYPDIKTKTYTSLTGDVRNQIIEILDEWFESKDVNDDYDVEAVSCFVANSSLFNCKITITYSESLAIAFCVHERIDDKVSAIHFLKSRVDIVGASTFVLARAAEHIYRESGGIINFEQDLGLPGLRQYKESLNPINYEAKYRVQISLPE